MVWKFFRRPLRAPPGRAGAARGEAAAATTAAGGRPGGDPRPHVAVVGAGAAGLAAAKALRAEHLRVTVFEQGPEPGGTWVLEPAVEAADLLGARSGRRGTHSSMYNGLRTNLPRELMGFSDFPFVAGAAGEGEGEGDARRFCGHAEVKAYLQRFAARFDLHSLTRYEHEVLAAVPGRRGPSWEWSLDVRGPGGGVERHAFDALCVCNGHYTQPRVPPTPGLASFRGHQLHSHNFREAGPEFRGKRVAVVGASASGEDISREIAGVAEAVYLSSQLGPGADTEAGFGPRGNIWRRPFVTAVAERAVTFGAGGAPVDVDVILWCTGYSYAFPFLEGLPDLRADDCVEPLYEHVFAPRYGASLSFVGLPFKVVPFPQFELQAMWVAKCLSGAATLPAEAEMARWAEGFTADLAERKVLRRHTHKMGDGQWEYNDFLAEQCGVPKLPPWRKAMYERTGANKRANPETYRDVHQDQDLAEEAHLSFATAAVATKA